MSTDIFGIAYAMRAISAQTPAPIKLSHAQQCAAAAFSYGSLAAYQASPDERTELVGARHVVLDIDQLMERARELGLPHDEAALVALIREAFVQKLPNATLHTTVDQLEDALREEVQRVVLNHHDTSSAMASTNNNGIDEIYLPLDVPWDDIPLDGETLGIKIEGHVSMTPDLERPYSGHRIDVIATLSLGRIRQNVLETADCHVESARLDYNWNGDDDRDSPKLSLVEAIAELLDLSFDDAQDLDDAEMRTLESDDGLVYGHVLDFTSTASASVAKAIKKAHGSLSIQVPPDFFDRVHGWDREAERHYVHGDQSEDQPGRFFCKQCDKFVDSAHFQAEHPGKAEERYFGSLLQWQRWPTRTKLNRRRPSNAVNVLAEQAEAQRRDREASRSAFHRWVALQEQRDDPVGDLARDIRGDRKFPISATSRQQIRAYIDRAARGSGASQAFDETWAEFSAGVA